MRKADNAVVREHGWRLWAGIMQPAAGLDWPVWYTWPNTTNAFVAEATLTNNIAASATSASLPKPRMGRLGASTLVPVDLPNTPDYNTIAAQVIKAILTRPIRKNATASATAPTSRSTAIS